MGVIFINAMTRILSAANFTSKVVEDISFFPGALFWVSLVHV